MYRSVIVCVCFLSLVCLGFACIFAHVLSFAGEMTAIRKELVAEKVEKLPMLGTWFYLDITDIQLLCHFPHDNSHMDALFFSEKPCHLDGTAGGDEKKVGAVRGVCFVLFGLYEFTVSCIWE